jgi:hypothetical protein
MCQVRPPLSYLQPVTRASVLSCTCLSLRCPSSIFPTSNTSSSFRFRRSRLSPHCASPRTRCNRHEHPNPTFRIFQPPTLSFLLYYCHVLSVAFALAQSGNSNTVLMQNLLCHSTPGITFFQHPSLHEPRTSTAFLHTVPRRMRSSNQIILLLSFSDALSTCLPF